MKTREENINELRESFKPVEAGKQFKVRSFTPEDAMGVVKCCYSVYGAGYPIDKYYIPEKLIEENSNGNLYSVVAVTEDGEVIGHGALYRSSPPFKDLYEGGQYIIQKEYRGTRAAYQINDFVHKKAIETGITGVYSEAVTNHLITQKFADRAGLASTAIEIDLMPAEAYETDDRVIGRNSSLFQFKIYKDHIHNIFVPNVYLEEINKLIKAVNLEREVGIQKNGAIDKESSVTEAEYFDFAGVGRLQVSVIGNDFETVFNEFERETKSRNYYVSQIFITIAQENCKDIFEMLNKKGYFFGGYLPRWVDKDAILLQKLAKKPTFEGINLYSEKSKQILEFIKEDIERVIKL